MAYVSPRTWALGETPTAAQLNQEIRDNELSLRGINDAAVKVFRTASQSIATGATYVAITWQSSVWNVGAMWASGTNPTRITVPTTGIYQIAVNIPWANNGTGRRAIGWRANGPGTVFAFQLQESTGVDTCNAAELISLQAGDYVEIMCFQTSGGALNVVGGSEQNASASLRLVASGSGEPPAWVAPRTWVDGNPAGILTPAILNTHIRDNVTSLRNLKGAAVSVYLVDDDSVESEQRAPISWGAAVWGVGGMWTSGSQLMAPVTGIYQITIHMDFDANANVDGVHGCGYVVNGSATHHDIQFQEQNNQTGIASGVDLVAMNAGDYIEIYAFQDSGESLSLKAGTLDRTRASLALLAATS